MSIDVVRYTEDNHDEWNKLVSESINGTLFHRLDFLEYHPDEYFETDHLMFYYKGQNLLGVMPLAVTQEEEQKRVARSPYGGSYGGIALIEDAAFRYVDDMIDELLTTLRDRDVDELVVCPAPREQGELTSCYEEFHYVDNGFDVTDRQVSFVVDLERFDDDPFGIYERQCRRAVRKSKKEGVTIETWSSDWEVFYEILNETFDRFDSDATPTHSLDELKWLAERFPNSVKLSLAFLDDTAIGGLVTFRMNDRTVLEFYNCHRTGYRNYNPVNHLIDTELRWAKDAGFRYFDQGVSVRDFDWRPGLIKFKESFGAKGHFRNYYATTL